MITKKDGDLIVELDFVDRVRGTFIETPWHMVCDLKRVLETTGKHEYYWNGRTQFDYFYSVPKCRKLFKLIIENTDDKSDLDDIERYIIENDKNKKCLDVWMKLRNVEN